MRSSVKTAIVTMVGALALAGCAMASDPGESSQIGATRVIPTGPAADYPMVLGEPYTIDGETYVPTDTMNSDQVGYAGIDDSDVRGITIAHKTLPLPSYIEITALSSGRTVLARVERRGPMTNARLIALSREAAEQLGIGDAAPVRVRRVNPPEDDRAELRMGRAVKPRMATPEGLLEVLRRRLPESGAASLAAAPQPRVFDSVPSTAIATIDPDDADAPETGPQPESQEVQATPRETPSGGFAVQVGAFSVKENAERLARELGGFVDDGGRFSLVRLGPFETRGEAEAALAKARGRGYSDARITTLK